MNCLPGWMGTVAVAQVMLAAGSGAVWAAEAAPPAKPAAERTVPLLASLQVTGAGAMTPAFEPQVFHYALRCEETQTLAVSAHAQPHAQPQAHVQHGDVRLSKGANDAMTYRAYRYAPRNLAVAQEPLGRERASVRLRNKRSPRLVPWQGAPPFHPARERVHPPPP